MAAPETQPPRAEVKAAVELYLALHRAPELSGAEQATAALLADRLTALGLTVHRGLAGTPSFLAELRNGPGPTVLIRTELDALPVTEATGLPYASTVPGAMHACGHDLHAAAALAATPHLAADPLLMAASVVLRLHTLTARESAPAEGAVLTVGTLHAGTRANVIPDRATLSLGLRAFTEPALDRLHEAVRRVLDAESQAAAAPRPPELTLTARSPVLTPDPALTAALRTVHAEHLGAGRVLAAAPSPATEDLTHLTALPDGTHVPLAYWMLGTTPAATWRAAAAEGRTVPANHAPDFAPDLRQALPTGITALTAAARHLLAAGPPTVGAVPPHPEAAP